MPTPRTTRAPHPRSWRVKAGVVAVAMLLAACSYEADTAGTSSGADGGAHRASSAQEAADTSAGTDTSGAPAAMVTTAAVGVVVRAPIKAAMAVSELVEASGGRVTERNESSPSAADDRQPWAYLAVRVPADQLTSVLSSLGTLGTVENTTVTSTDVSMKVTDIAARIEALQVSVDRLETFVSQAASTTALLEAEATLTERQSDLEALQAEQARLGDQIALTTLEITLTTSATVPESAPAGFVGGLQTGWDALTATLGVVVLALGVALPWLVLAGAGYLVWRRVRRRVRGTPA